MKLCEHDMEWYQPQNYAGRNWICSGCSTHMSPGAMILWHEIRALKALIKEARDTAASVPAKEK